MDTHFDFMDPMFGLDDSLSIYSNPNRQKKRYAESILEEKFKLAPIMQPKTFCKRVKESNTQNKKLMDFAKGTTTMGFKYDGGIIIAVDSRASMGQYIASETVRKVIEINEFLLGTMAGGAADCQFWEAWLNMQCRVYELKHGQRMTVAAASKVLNNVCLNYRGYGLSMGLMIAGSDKTGERLFYIDNDGTRLEGDFFAVGSGGTYATGVYETNFKKNMSDQDAIDLGVKAIYHATHRDAGSGGFCRVYHIRKQGWRKVHDGLDVNQLHWKFQEGKMDIEGDNDLVKEFQ